MPNAEDVIIEEAEGEDEDESFDQAMKNKNVNQQKKMRTTSFKEVQNRSNEPDSVEYQAAKIDYYNATQKVQQMQKMNQLTSSRRIVGAIEEEKTEDE